MKIKKEKTEDIADFLNMIMKQPDQVPESILPRPVSIKKEPVSDIESKESRENVISKLLVEQTKSIQKKRKGSGHKSDSSPSSKKLKKQDDIQSADHFHNGAKKKLIFESEQKKAQKILSKVGKNSNKRVSNEGVSLTSPKTMKEKKEVTSKQNGASTLQNQKNKLVSGLSVTGTNKKKSPISTKKVAKRDSSTFEDSNQGTSLLSAELVKKGPSKKSNQTSKRNSHKEIPHPKPKQVKQDSKRVTQKDSESSSDEDVAPAKPKEYNRKTENSESSSDEEFPTKVKQVEAKMQKIPRDKYKDTESSSEEEVASLKPIQTKQKYNQESESSSSEEVTPPKPIQTKQEVDDSESSSGDEVAPLKYIQTRKSDSSSSEEVAPPNPIQIKREYKQESEDSESSSSEEVASKPLQNKQAYNRESKGSKTSLDPSESSFKGKHNKLLGTQNIAQGKFEDTESSSEEEVAPPKPIQTKQEYKQESEDSESSSGEEVASKLIQTKLGSKTSSNKNESPFKGKYNKLGTKKIYQEKSEDTESSSEEEVAPPKPIQTKEEYKQESEDSESSSGEEVASKVIQTKRGSKTSSNASESPLKGKKIKLGTQKIYQGKSEDTESSSDEEVAPPKPIQTKQEYKQESEDSESSSGEEVASKVIQTKQGSKTSSNASESPLKGKNIKLGTQKIYQGKSRDTESSSEEEVAPPKPIQTKQEHTQESEDSESSSGEELASKPIQKKQQYNRKSKSSESSSDLNEPPLKRKHMLAKHKLESQKISQAKSEDTESSSEEDVAPPKPIQTKQEYNQESEDSDSSPDTNKSPLKSKHIKLGTQTISQRKSEDTESSSEEETKPIQTKQVYNHESKDLESSSNEEGSAPKPMQIKQEYNGTSDEHESPSRVQKSVAQTSTSKPDSNSDSESDASPSKTRTPQSFSQFKQMDLIDKLKLKYPGIKKQTCRVKLPENAKYSVVLVPKTIDPQSLLNLKCYLNTESLVILNKKEYIFQPSSVKPDPLLLSVDGGKIVQPESVQVLQRYVPKLVGKEPEVVLRENIALPMNLKPRHPLFGVNYKAKLHLDRSVKVKLHEAIENKHKVEMELIKRKKKKKKKSKNVEEVEENVMHYLNSIDSFTDMPSSSSAVSTKKQKAKKNNFTTNGLDKLLKEMHEEKVKPKKSKRVI